MDEALPKLLDRHRQVADRLLAGGTAEAAYRQVYPKAGKANAKSDAYKVLQRPEVKAYLTEQRAQAATRAGISAELVMCGLLKIAQDDSDPSTTGARVKAYAELAKLIGIVPKAGVELSSADDNIKVIFGCVPHDRRNKLTPQVGSEDVQRAAQAKRDAKKHDRAE